MRAYANARIRIALHANAFLMRHASIRIRYLGVFRVRYARICAHSHAMRAHSHRMRSHSHRMRSHRMRMRAFKGNLCMSGTVDLCGVLGLSGVLAGVADLLSVESCLGAGNDDWTAGVSGTLAWSIWRCNNVHIDIKSTSVAWLMDLGIEGKAGCWSLSTWRRLVHPLLWLLPRFHVLPIRPPDGVLGRPTPPGHQIAELSCEMTQLPRHPPGRQLWPGRHLWPGHCLWPGHHLWSSRHL